MEMRKNKYSAGARGKINIWDMYLIVIYQTKDKKGTT